ncbi:transposase [Caballeronia sordidicola]|uniref:transposase n=1 Tax=Caballeronia sordidicola TaxID=196367 RepID=UPI000B77555C
MFRPRCLLKRLAKNNRRLKKRVSAVDSTPQWVVERTHAWFHNFHRLRVRYERLAMIHEAFLKFAACLICWNTLQRSTSAF